MSIELIRGIFSDLPKCKEWHLHLLGYTHSKKNGTIYNCRRIELSPQNKINDHIENISTLHIDNEKGKLLKYTDVREYDGSCNGTTVYRISQDNKDITIGLDELLNGVANFDSEADPFEIKTQAYILCGKLTIDKKEHQIKLVAMNSPITTLKNKFVMLGDKGVFSEITKKVLNLRTTINVVIYDKTVYFLDMAGESLFNMERAYKIKCEETIGEIEKMGIVSDFEAFKDTASKGQNPRRFTSFSKRKLELLNDKDNREKVAETFNILLDEKTKQFDTGKKEDSEKLVKVLCGKGMWDILEEVPVEVDSSKGWGK